MSSGNVSSTMETRSFIYSGTELGAMAEASNYCRWIMHYFGPFLGRRIAEIGAGTGSFSEILLKSKRTESLVLFEAADNLFPQLSRRFSDERVRLHHGVFDPRLLVEPADSVVLVNVLEHVLDDEALLLQIHQSLRASGTLLLFVPALEWNYGSLDRSFGHHRRYNKRNLNRKLRSAGFQIRQMRYVNIMGVASWFVAGNVLRQTTLKPAQVRWYDRWIIPWSFKLEELCEPLLGQNLLAIAQK